MDVFKTHIDVPYVGLGEEVLEKTELSFWKTS